MAKDLVVIGANWCGYCVKLKTYLKNNPTKISKFNTEYIDIDKHPELKGKLNIAVYPTSLIFDDNNKIISRHEGFSAISYSQWLKNNE